MAAATDKAIDKRMEKLALEENEAKRSSKRGSRRKLSIAADLQGIDSPGLDGVSQGRHMSVTHDECKGDNLQRVFLGKDEHPFTSFASVSQVGYVPFNPAKVNQDRHLQVVEFNKDPTQALFGVFDGHGLHGDEVSQFLTEEMANCLLHENAQFSESPQKNFLAGFKRLTEKLKFEKSVNTSFSGSTCITCVIRGRAVHTANVGDSRAVLGRKKKNGNMEAIALSVDQKPDASAEKKRILRAKGRVQACKGPLGQNIGPARVWLLKQDVPGLAMSRSFGDDVARTVGVISEPVVKQNKLKDSDKVIVLGSDGIFEFMSNQEVVSMAMKFDDAHDAATALTNEATKRWKDNEDVIDDITCTVVFL